MSCLREISSNKMLSRNIEKVLLILVQLTNTAHSYTNTCFTTELQPSGISKVTVFLRDFIWGVRVIDASNVDTNLLREFLVSVRFLGSTLEPLCYYEMAVKLHL